MNKKAKGKAKDKGEDIVAKVVKDYQASWDYVSTNYHSTWEKCYKLYNNTRVDVGYKGVTKTFVPITFSTIETQVASIAGGKPKFMFVPTRAEQEDDTEVLNALLDYYWDCDKWTVKTTHWIRDMLLYGTGVMYIYWDINKPRLINVPVRDFFIDPTATTLENASYMGRRFLATKAELESFEIVNPETGEMEKMYKNLDEVGNSTSGDKDHTDKQEKDMYMGATLKGDAVKELIEVIEYWTEDKVQAVLNRSVLSRDDTNPYKVVAMQKGVQNPKGLKPFIVQRDYADESLFYGKGEVEPILQQQELLNDLTNQNIDAVSYILNPMYTLDPKYSDWIDKIENIPGAVYPFQQGALVPVPMGNVPSDAFNERLNIKNEIRETTGIDEIIKGVNTQGGTQTATEVSMQIQQSGQRSGIKITQIENDGYYTLGKLVFEMMKLYVEEPMMVRVVGQKGVSWVEFDPYMYEGEYEPKIQLEATQVAKRHEELKKYQEMFMSMMGNPYVDQKELTKYTLQKMFELDPDEVDILMKDDQELAQSMAGMGGMPPEGDPTSVYQDVAGAMPPPIEGNPNLNEGQSLASLSTGVGNTHAMNSAIRATQNEF